VDATPAGTLTPIVAHTEMWRQIALRKSTIIKENPMKFVKLLSDWSVLTKVMANGHDLTTNLESQGIY
jgi:hypothetical protein